MADQNPPNHNSVNPLFNMMDELLARHRHGAAAPADDIPVLTEVAPKTIPSLFDVVDDIPALTDVVEPSLADKIANLELEWGINQHEPDIGHLDAEVLISKPKAKPMSLEIEPLPFQTLTGNKNPSIPPAPVNTVPFVPKQTTANSTIPQLPVSGLAPIQTTAAPSEPVFLDLPMLDLDELSRAPTPEYLDLPSIITSSQRDPVTHPPIETFIATDLVLPLDELLAEPATQQADFMATLDEVSLAAAAIPQVPLSENELACDEPSEFTLDIIAPESAQDTANTLLLAEVADASEQAAIIIEAPIMAESTANLAVPLAATPADHQTAISLNWDEDESSDEELLLYSSADTQETIAINLDNNTLRVEPSTVRNETAEADSIEGISPEINTEEAQPAIPTKLTTEHVAEITASVGAQLSLDIATEVEKLAKQQFDSLMAQFYSEALHKLTDEIMASLEVQLSQRIADLVAVELRSKNLL